MHEQVIDKRALLGHQSRIMRLSNGKPGRIVASDVLHEVKRALPPHFNFAHVADVKQTRGGARSQMLAENPGILHGHIPAAEIDHLGAQAPMCGVQCGLSKLCRGWRSHAGFSAIIAKNKN
jgi:hypothetical protein